MRWGFLLIAAAILSTSASVVVRVININRNPVLAATEYRVETPEGTRGKELASGTITQGVFRFAIDNSTFPRVKVRVKVDGRWYHKKNDVQSEMDFVVPKPLPSR
jgi:hypothetical protein